MQPGKVDVCILCAAADRSIARTLSTRLKSDGISNIVADGTGDLDSASINAGTLLVLLSSQAMITDLSRLEREAILFLDPANGREKFVPVCIEPVELPESFRQFAAVDWISRSEDEYEYLRNVCCPLLTDSSEEFVRIDQRGGRTLRGHSAAVTSVAITPDGRIGLSASEDKTIRVWDLERGACTGELTGHVAGITSIAISADGKVAVSGGKDNRVLFWDLQKLKLQRELAAHKETVWCVAISARGDSAVSGGYDYTLKLHNLATRKDEVISANLCAIRSVAIAPNGSRVVSSGDDCKIRLWDAKTNALITGVDGESRWRLPVAITKDGHVFAAGSSDGRIRVWNERTGGKSTINGHIGEVRAIAITPDGRFAASGGDDRTVRLWNLRAGRCEATLEGHTEKVTGIALAANCERALSCSEDGTVRVWNIAGLERYTNAKVLLVGDSGVGKTGLAIRLATSRFEATISTDAAWATQMQLPPLASKQTHEREVWLWDFAGQSDYRLIHQLYMDETSLAVLIFNPQNDNPFEGLLQWNRDLERAARRTFNKLLVAGRCDRGGPTISKDAIERFRVENRFSDFLATSALTGAGCRDLHAAIVNGIPWDEIPWTASPATFKALKQEILKIKDEGKVLLRTSELHQHLQLRLPHKGFSIDELRAVIGLLAGPGVVWQLEFGDFVLLQPERINAYAAAVVRAVRAHTDEIGCIFEEDVLSGKLDYQDMTRLQRDEEQIVLRAMHQIFVDHGLCMREHTDRGTILVFPSYFKRERPDLGEHPSAFVTYEFSASINEVYSTLIVRLNHTTQFEKVALWHYAADFKTPEGKRVGLKLIHKPESRAEITVYFDPTIPDDTKVTFIRYVHDHLKAKDANIARVRHYVCPHCNTAVENRKAVEHRIQRGEKDVVCISCEGRIPLLDLIETKFASEEFKKRVRELEEEAKTNIDNESRELILLGHAFAIAGEAGQIFRPTPNSDWGLDGEIEFKDYSGRASGRRLYVQLKSGNSYLTRRKSDDAEVFTVKNQRHLEYWVNQAYPVMLVIRTSDGNIRWMDVSAHLKTKAAKAASVGKGEEQEPRETPNQIIFKGEPFNAQSVLRIRDKFVPRPKNRPPPKAV